MPNKAKTLMGFAITVALLVIAVTVASNVRSQSGGQMSIDGLPVNNARVTGTWTPDFLWSGKAWTIEVQSDEDLELRLDDMTYVIPKGSHEIYSNHDSTNTGQFGDHDFWGYPERIEVRSFNRKP